MGCSAVASDRLSVIGLLPPVSVCRLSLPSFFASRGIIGIASGWRRNQIPAAQSKNPKDFVRLYARGSRIERESLGLTPHKRVTRLGYRTLMKYLDVCSGS